MEKRAVMPTTWLLVALLLMVGLRFVVRGTVFVEMPWGLIGLVPLALGIALNLAADAALRKATTTVKPFQRSSTLVTDSVYGLTRHPMYLGFVLLLAGVTLLLGTATSWLILVPFAVLLDRGYIVVEERMLADTFGSAWTAYTSRVRRWIGPK